MPLFGTLAPPPYREAAPDGNQYFKVLRPYLGLAETYAHALQVKRRYESVPHPEARLKARLVARLITELNQEVKAAEVLTAGAAQRAVTARLGATRHRPQGRNLLVNSIECRPIGTLPFHTGAVGIGDISVLNKAADDQGRPYWAAQEFGSDHLVGKTVYGFFQPGYARPLQAAFRQHAYFEVDDVGFPMHIRRPIPAKAFLRGGAADAEQFRYRTMTRVAGKTAAEIERILASGTPLSGPRGRRRL
jgi:hypothetical protein